MQNFRFIYLRITTQISFRDKLAKLFRIYHFIFTYFEFIILFSLNFQSFNWKKLFTKNTCLQSITSKDSRTKRCVDNMRVQCAGKRFRVGNSTLCIPNARFRLQEHNRNEKKKKYVAALWIGMHRGVRLKEIRRDNKIRSRGVHQYA